MRAWERCAMENRLFTPVEPQPGEAIEDNRGVLVGGAAGEVGATRVRRGELKSNGLAGHRGGFN